MEKYTINMNGRNITIRGEVANAHELYEGSPSDSLASYYAHLATGKEDADFLVLPDEALSKAIEDGFKKEVIELSGEKVWIALFSGNKDKAAQLLQLPKDKR